MTSMIDSDGNPVIAEFGPGRSGILRLPIFPESSGNLTSIEGQKHIPFEIRQVQYLFDVPGGSSCDGHAHRESQEVLIALSGSFDVLIDNGRTKHHFFLNRSHLGLYIGPFIWREINNFASNSVCLILASMYFDENDYFRTYESFSRALESRL